MLEKCQCIKCGKTLLFYEIEKGLVEVKCRNNKCGVVNSIFCEYGICKIVDKFEYQKKICYSNITVNKKIC